MGLGDLAGPTFSSIANGVSADGSIVVGRGATGSGQEAFIWDVTNGMVGLVVLPGGIVFNSIDIAIESSIRLGGFTLPHSSTDSAQLFRYLPCDLPTKSATKVVLGACDAKRSRIPQAASIRSNAGALNICQPLRRRRDQRQEEFL